jgi:hypothetical protein
MIANRMTDILRLEQFGSVPVGFGVLRELYRDYANPARKIADLCSQGLLVRLKRSLYIVPTRNGRDDVSGYLIANHLYGPSYLSLETALQYYGMIPEGVYSYESVTFRRSKQYRTPQGSFRYHYLPKQYYSIGMRIERPANQSFLFLMATPAKAVCDMLVKTKGLQVRSRKSMYSYLTEFMRMDEDMLSGLDTQIIRDCAKAGPKKDTLRFLEETIEWIKSSSK